MLQILAYPSPASPPSDAALVLTSQQCASPHNHSRPLRACSRFDIPNTSPSPGAGSIVFFRETVGLSKQVWWIIHSFFAGSSARRNPHKAGAFPVEPTTGYLVLPSFAAGSTVHRVIERLLCTLLRRNRLAGFHWLCTLSNPRSYRSFFTLVPPGFSTSSCIFL